MKPQQEVLLPTPKSRAWLNRIARRKFVILASRFNREIVESLLQGACDVLRRLGLSEKNIRVFWVPGAFELPVVAARIAKGKNRPCAIIALGALIRGQTKQYEVLANAVANGLLKVSIKTGVPISFGVIVATTLSQARARAGIFALRRHGKQAGLYVGNRGREAALAAVDVLRLFDLLS